MNLHKQLVVIGGGPAGMAAAISAKENGIDDILILERGEFLGGILNQCIHAGFGLHTFNEELTGPEYATRYTDRIEALKIEYSLNTMVLSIKKDKTIVAVSRDKGLMNIKTEAVILAMGCRERTRGAINIAGSRPAGIFTAGTAQYYINIMGKTIGKKIVILGSGDIGLIMARRLTLEGAEVKTVLELLPYSNGLGRNIAQCLEDFDIPLMLSHTIVGITGKERLEGITIASVDEKLTPIPGSEQFIECDTLLLSVGLIPENELTTDAEVEIDQRTSGAVINENLETSVEGIFACGNVLHVHDLVDYVSDEAARAGKKATQYLKNGITKNEYKNIIAQNGVRYCVPQKFEKLTPETPLFFRVTTPCDRRFVAVFADGEAVYKKREAYLTPSEMQIIKLNDEICEKLNKATQISIELI
ncbi:MAG: pyridine nucleotide-disulfide oxidoreductase [Clostridiales bacterium GWF2_38_85]|nr:MAG: pyridine nucleotide-disulfide oxidoreductase [Clostridiales bacterium GWF2_38_85]HBL84122.1 pyridine nucleotide-disulfide oxidoreductase [Clostridiales bacterium]